MYQFVIYCVWKLFKICIRLSFIVFDYFSFFDHCSLFLIIAYCVRLLLIVFDYLLLRLILFDLLLVCV